MALVISRAGRLKPEIRLAQALSEYEAILVGDQKARIRGYRLEATPTAADVMRLTAEIDREAVRTRKSRRCVGPRLCNFLQAVQMFTGVVDVVVGGAQSLTASAIWGVVKLSLQLTSTIPSYFEQLSALFMSIGRTCTRNQEYLLLYSRSIELKEAICEYFVVTVNLCRQAVLFLQRPLLGQLYSAMGNTIMSELGGFEQKLGRLAGVVAEEVTLASRRLQVQEAEHNSKFRLSSLATSAESKKWRSEQMERRFLKTCSTYDHQAAWKQTRKQGNVDWFLREQAYTDWKMRTASSVLHCTGTLGSGKSVLTANIVDDLVSSHPSPLVAYFFCRYNDSESLSARTIIGSITRQILSLLKAALTSVASEFEKEIMGLDEVFDTLLEVISTNDFKAQDFCVIIDGIDECKEADAKVVLDCLSRLVNSSSHIFHIFCSSRPNTSQWAFKVLPPDYTMSMSASGCRDEMIPYIAGALETSLESGRLSVGNPEIITKIKDTLLENADGMYLWVALQIDSICSQPTDKAILNALKNIPKDLPGTFNRILGKLRNSKDYASHAAYSVTLFRVVAAARRPLMLDELREAVSVEQGEIKWDPEQLVNDMQKVLNCCGSLLVVDEEDFTVRFIHQSVRQFLCSYLVDKGVWEYRMDLASVALDLGNICVTYLNSERHIVQIVKQKPYLMASSATLRKAVPTSNVAGRLAVRLLSNKKDVNHNMRPSLEVVGALSSSSSSDIRSHNFFLPYAQENWLYHTTQLCSTTQPRIWHLWKRLATGEVETARLPWSPEECIKFSTTFIDSVLETQQWNLILVYMGRVYGSEIAKLKPVYYALTRQAAVREHANLTQPWEIRQLVQLLNAYFSPCSPDYQIIQYSPALQVAAYMGYIDFIQWLLKNGADINLQHGTFNTALQAACVRGYEVIVTTLVENGADVNLQGGTYGTALQAACRSGSYTIVKLLLQKGASVNVQGGTYDSALQAACRWGSHAIVKLLLEKGAHNYLQGGTYGMALHAACLKHDEAIVKLLLEKGTDVNLQDKVYGTALHVACQQGDEAITILLLEAGADINLRGEICGTALQVACDQGHEAIVKLLLERGADVDIQDWKYGTVLQVACRRNDETLVKLLVKNGANLNLQGVYGAALQVACDRGHEAILIHLLENGADVNLRSEICGTALRVACDRGHEAIVKLLLKSEADVNFHDWKHGTALQAAHDGGHDAIVKLLLENGANINLRSDREENYKQYMPVMLLGSDGTAF